ncbi:hypothetical protein BDW74DRAFT_75176 [Aspergillus multicolor]|uniref:uncharacterized protein n=1 Tax=Aspergillus multicolor TaxID=41759 RepID=UPI003CCD1517
MMGFSVVYTLFQPLVLCMALVFGRDGYLYARDRILYVTSTLIYSKRDEMTCL